MTDFVLDVVRHVSMLVVAADRSRLRERSCDRKDFFDARIYHD